MISIAIDTLTINSLNELITKSTNNKNSTVYNRGEYLGTIAAILTGAFFFSFYVRGWKKCFNVLTQIQDFLNSRDYLRL